MIAKTAPSLVDAVSNIEDGASVAISGFGAAGSPVELIHALIDHGAKGLTVINNNAGNGGIGLAALIASGQVAKIICSYPRSAGSIVFPDLYRAGKIDLEVVPQGTLAERLRAAGAAALGKKGGAAWVAKEDVGGPGEPASGLPGGAKRPSYGLSGEELLPEAARRLGGIIVRYVPEAAHHMA